MTSGASPAPLASQNGRSSRTNLWNPWILVLIIFVLVIVIVVLAIITAGRAINSSGNFGISVVGVDGEFKNAVYSGAEWRMQGDVPTVFADAAVDAAQAQSPPGEIRLTISKERQKKADDVLDAARIDDFGRDSFKPDGAVVVIDPRDGGVRAVATRGQAAGNANLATGLTANPGELAVLLSAAAMDKDGLVGLHPDETGASGCKDFPAVVQNSCTGSFKALQEQLGAGFLLRAQTIACGLGFNGMGYQVNGVRIAASSALPRESCGGDPTVATDAPIQATPFQLAVAMSAFAARVVARPALCPHFVQPVSVGSCPIEGIPLTADIAQYIRDEMTAGNGNAALMNSWSADNSSSTGWAVGFAPAQNPTVAVAVYIKGRSATNATPAKQAAHDTAKTLLGSAG